MSEITFKGTSSTTYSSLIISELPPIIKPKQRTNQYYIDGRSGIITEYLGYESYQKTAKIGLKNTTELDDITQWLDGEGDVIFSNEPDKVYRGSIIEQIDYNRLGKRFLQLENVTWLVYPYKYLGSESAVELTIGVESTITNQGNINALPYIEIEGTGQATVLINEAETCYVMLTSVINTVAVDSEDGGLVYHPTTKLIYPNLLVGTFPELMPGENTIKITGANVTAASVLARSRFI